MSSPTRIRLFSSALVVSGLFAAGALGVACDPVPHDGDAVMRGECASCHMPEYEAAVQPLHVGAFPTTCGECHDEQRWSPATHFDHARFPLRGAHQDAACNDCHTQGFARGDTPDTCVGCHREDYDQATVPSHATFSTDCDSCHQETAWRPARFDHEWPLTGAHEMAVCASCHVGDPPVYEGTSTLCVDCHRDDYDTSPYPGHSSFATTCQDCHSTTAWLPASFEHAWPLTGAHAAARCVGCHAGNPPRYAGTSKVCVDCHRDDYDGSAFPGHSGFATTCQDCHTTTAWLPASFEHAWPLTGAHAMARCAGCHVGNPPLYAGTGKLCVDCHREDYDTSPYLGHSSFATTCQDCHTTQGWTPATGGHPEAAFPIKTGAHGGVSCTQCHDASLGPTGKDNANCIGCHEHDRAGTDEHHKEESGYTYANSSCLKSGCHPDGRKHD